MDSFLSEIIAKYNLRKSGNRWVGPCPHCGGSKTSDKFQLFADGGFRCYACDFRGDRIKWLRSIEGMSCPEAHIAAGVQCKSISTCPVKDTCRMGTGEKQGQVQIRKGRTVTPPPPDQGKSLPTIDPKHPNDKWLAWATELLDKSIADLAANDEVMSWLSRRGIDGDTTRRFKLGWLDHDRRIDRKSIGLSPLREGKTKLWVPGGLVIPIMTGTVLHRLRIRRTDEAREKFLQKRKYVWLEGSGNLPMTIPPTGTLRGAVIVEAELDAIAVASAHHDVAIIAIGSVSGGLQPALKARLGDCPVILVALDAEPGQDGKPGPGPEWAAIWQSEFRNAKYWPVPVGKDPGDYVKAGGNISEWIEAGLPFSAVSRDLPSSPGCFPTEGGGEEEKPHPEKTKEGNRGRQKAPAKDVEELKALLAEANGFFSVYGRGSGVGPRLDQEWSRANPEKRARISELLNTSDEIDALISRLDDGVYNHITLPV